MASITWQSVCMLRLRDIIARFGNRVKIENIESYLTKGNTVVSTNHKMWWYACARLRKSMRSVAHCCASCVPLRADLFCYLSPSLNFPLPPLFPLSLSAPPSFTVALLSQMCILFISVNQHPRFPFIMVGNRDEFFARPTTQAHFWTRDDGTPEDNLIWGGM